jgi:DUF4097 and DUF4098 domain-containing protein YvlB
VQAGELKASRVRLQSGGGNITIKRLIGLEVELHSCRGNIEVGAVYGTKAMLATEGGNLQLSHGACTGLLAVETEGGAAEVEGLEGNASIISAGGNVKVSLSLHARKRRRSCEILVEYVRVLKYF